jgi:hypothetical protein
MYDNAYAWLPCSSNETSHFRKGECLIQAMRTFYMLVAIHMTGFMNDYRGQLRNGHLAIENTQADNFIRFFRIENGPASLNPHKLELSGMRIIFFTFSFINAKKSILFSSGAFLIF